MKKQVLISASVMIAFVLIAFSAKAQSVTVNVKLADASGFGTNPNTTGPAGSNVVNFDYNSADKYGSTQTQTIPNQLYAVSTKAYNLMLKAETASFAAPAGAATGTTPLPASILRVSASRASANSFQTEITPSTTAAALISGESATTGRGYDIRYNIPPNDALLNAAKGTHTITLTYTVVAQ